VVREIRQRTINVPSRDRYRRYGSIRILRDGRVQFSEWTLPGRDDFSFTVVPGRNGTRLSISVSKSGRTVLFLFMTRGRVTSAGFPYDLRPEELREVVSDLRAVGRGIERWIVPGLEQSQASSTLQKDHPETLKVVSELVASVGDLPVAEPWRQAREKLRRQWAAHLQTHPEDMATVPATWLLSGEGAAAKPQLGKASKTTRLRKRSLRSRRRAGSRKNY